MEAPFQISSSNVLVAASCDVLAVLDSSYGDVFSQTGCNSTCSSEDNSAAADPSFCIGIDCCESTIPGSIPDSYKILFQGGVNETTEINDDDCKFAFLADYNNWSDYRDVKTTSILLDEKYKAKVADFGTSRTISIEQSHLTTFVNGTFSYLDPKYFQSSQFTDKSDVYSFGVVLVELLTGQKAISAIRIEEGRNLAMYFIMSMKGNTLFDVVDTLVLEDGSRDKIMFVARLALKFLSSNGRNRPTMKQVATELERVQKLERLESIRDAKEKYDAIGFDGTEFISRWDSASSSTGSTLDSTNCSSTLQELPLLSFEPR